MDQIDRVFSACRKAKAHAACEKRRYHALRNAVIEFLGGKCKHVGCDVTDPHLLEIHHVEPSGDGGWKKKRGCDKIHFWKGILASKEKGELYCHQHHIEDAHNGNTREVRKG